MSNRETQRKGDTAKAAALSYFTEIGCDVAILISESAPYDIIVDDGTGLYRVQVKYTKNWYVDMRRIHSNSTGYVVRHYLDTDFDWLFVYNPEQGQFLIKNVPTKSYVSYSLSDIVKFK